MPPLAIPQPTQEELQHSQHLQSYIVNKIHESRGWIPFSHFMELALYTPGLGYYSANNAKFGFKGDFVTAPEISTLFGRTLARQAIQLFRQLGQTNILEFGAGSGKLAFDLLTELEQFDQLPMQYLILEISAELQQRQRSLFETHAPQLLDRITWLTELPEQFSGLIIANEVLDAMPTHLIVWKKDELFERGVSVDQQAFTWSDKPLINNELLAIASQLSTLIDRNEVNFVSYLSEISLANRYFIHSLSKILQSGLILLIDYGFGQREYYHPQRSMGTVMCHYRHYAHDDPFYLPGLQDITSHVDFSAIAQIASENSLQLVGYTNQAHFLINCGITELLSNVPASDTLRYLPLANQLQRLVSPAEMGELFKVIALGKQLNETPIGFTRGNLIHLL